MPVFDEQLNEQGQLKELSYWLAFAWLSGAGLGFAKIKALYECFQSLEEAWKAPEYELRKLTWLNELAKQKLIAYRKQTNPDELLSRVMDKGIKAFHYYHPGYPRLLREIHDPPIVLFQKGNLSLENLGATIGIVGTRRPTAYGQKLVKEMARGLAENGVTVVSGMALGIDSLAHRGAIEVHGTTVAVLGSGVDVCYPSSNKPLYKSLTEASGQAIVSEFLPGTWPEKWHFPARNRIIAGMSEAILVIEAGEESGALITARMAMDENRDVYAMPGRVDSPMSAGCNDLIVRNTAHLCKNYTDIMKDMGWAVSQRTERRPTVVQLHGREGEVFDLISAEPVHFDYLLDKTGMNTGELSATLTMLELASVIRRLPGDWYAQEG